MRKFLIIFLFCSVVLAADKPYRILNSFNAGELSPLLTAREDLSKFQSGCSVMENMIPLPQGGAQKRPGTIYVAESKNNTKIRLLPFQFSTTQSYIIECGNQYMRFYTSNAVIYETYGTEDLTGFGANVIAQWKCNDNLADKVVIDTGDAADHAGESSANTSVLTTTDESGTANKAFDCTLGDGSESFDVVDHADFTFVTGGADDPFSLHIWVYYVSDAGAQIFIQKWDGGGAGTHQEWFLGTTSADKIEFKSYDESGNDEANATTLNALADGWHFIVATYSGLGGSSAANGMKIYVDWVEWETTKTTDAGYVAMEDEDAPVWVGRHVNGKVHNAAVFDKELTYTEITSLIGSASTTPTEIETPYLTANLFELKFEQSADVLYLTHPDYESRKLSRLSNAIWSLDAIGIENGPFRTQNDDTNAKISASATTGSVTLTATGHAPFVASATAGHVPSSAVTSKSQTGALFKIIHPLAEIERHQQLTNNYTASQVENTSWQALGTLFKDATWTLETQGTWTGTLEIQRNYTIGAAHDASGWEAAFEYSSSDDRNVSTTGTEDYDDASYRAILLDSGDAAEDCEVYFSTDQTDHIGIVEITAVASTTSATATVLTTLGSTDATHKWSEGAWSNYRGWPRTVTFFEDRLCFGGNDSQPDTIWGSVTADYENMLAGADDDDAVLFTLSSKQVNIIQWIIGKDKILIGTSGAEWTLAGSADEPLTPSNVKAEQHSSYGSADLQAVLANESVLFFQQGAERMRELAYNWELDSYVAPDMTILSKEITGDGITDTAFQQIPDAILWCVRDDGDIATFSYERKENITAWSKQITDGDFESVAVICGDPEDEVWASVARVISGATVRYIEYFSPRDFGDAEDAFFVDCGMHQDSTTTTAVSGLSHLEGETVYVLGNGDVLDAEVVSNAVITISATSTQVRAGLPYTVQMRTMPLSWIAQGMTIHGRIKRISEVITSWYKSGDFSIGRDADTLQTYSLDGQTTDEDKATFPPGNDRYGYVFFYQKSPEPLTILAVMITFIVF